LREFQPLALGIDESWTLLAAKHLPKEAFHFQKVLRAEFTGVEAILGEFHGGN
jgi:hypothetical protein